MRSGMKSNPYPSRYHNPYRILTRTDRGPLHLAGQKKVFKLIRATRIGPKRVKNCKKSKTIITVRADSAYVNLASSRTSSPTPRCSPPRLLQSHISYTAFRANCVFRAKRARWILNSREVISRASCVFVRKCARSSLRTKSFRVRDPLLSDSARDPFVRAESFCARILHFASRGLAGGPSFVN